MKVYSVVCPQCESQDLTLLGGFTDAPERAFSCVEQAREVAAEYARLHPGETFWVVEGVPAAAFRVEPAEVTVVEMASS
jgi:hypothetical protein